jgi:DMSO/TMAO reductase YedYZ molybdopterin-dependent catalytic subunit
MKPGLVLLIILICIVTIAWIFTAIQTPTGIFEPDSRELSGVEIRDYEGEKLNSAFDFRENSIRGPQKVDIDSYQLSITGLTDKSQYVSYQEILSSFPSYSKVVTLHCVEGWDVTILWEGKLVSDIIRTAGVQPEANTIIFYAVDGYSTSFPLDYILDNPILLAYRMNNQTLPVERGYPFQLVAENKWGYKWIKWVSKIKLTNDPTYKGYWESRGYNNDGEVNRSFF